MSIPNVRCQIFVRDRYCFHRREGLIHVVAIVVQHSFNPNQYRVFVKLDDDRLILIGRALNSAKAADRRIDDIDYALFTNGVVA